MNVLVLAMDDGKEELLAQPVHEDLHIQWLTEPAGMQASFPVDACIDLLFDNSHERMEWLRQLQAPLIVVNSVITPLEKIHDDFIRINGWATFLGRPVIEAACRKEALKAGAEQLFALLGRTTAWVPDVAGFITPRVVACIINEAFMALEETVSVEAEMDTAMKLGTNYPLGPFEWAQRIGLQPIHSLLETLAKEQARYKPSELLKKKILV